MSIPDRFDTPALRLAYARGREHASGIARHCVPVLGETVDPFQYPDFPLNETVVTPENIREVHIANCWEAENTSRSFSPFEVTASEFNRMSNADELWEAFDTGVRDAIDNDLATYTDHDYGINKPIYCPHRPGHIECETPDRCVGGGECRLGPLT